MRKSRLRYDQRQTTSQRQSRMWTQVSCSTQCSYRAWPQSPRDGCSQEWWQRVRLPMDVFYRRTLTTNRVFNSHCPCSGDTQKPVSRGPGSSSRGDRWRPHWRKSCRVPGTKIRAETGMGKARLCGEQRMMGLWDRPGSGGESPGPEEGVLDLSGCHCRTA